MPVGTFPTATAVISERPVDESNTETLLPVRFTTYTRVPAALTTMP